MKQVTFNNLINLEYPEDFKILSEEEGKKYFSGNLMRLSFHNEERHILISLSKSKNSFLNYFFPVASVARNAINSTKHNLKDFQFVGEFTSTIFNVPAITECFSYTSNNSDVKQYGELSVFKYKRTIYAIYCVSRLDNKEKDKEVFEDFRNSFKKVSL